MEYRYYNTCLWCILQPYDTAFENQDFYYIEENYFEMPEDIIIVKAPMGDRKSHYEYQSIKNNKPWKTYYFNNYFKSYKSNGLFEDRLSIYLFISWKK